MGACGIVCVPVVLCLWCCVCGFVCGISPFHHCFFFSLTYDSTQFFFLMPLSLSFFFLKCVVRRIEGLVLLLSRGVSRECWLHMYRKCQQHLLEEGSLLLVYLTSSFQLVFFAFIIFLEKVDVVHEDEGSKFFYLFFSSSAYASLCLFVCWYELLILYFSEV